MGLGGGGYRRGWGGVIEGGGYRTGTFYTGHCHLDPAGTDLHGAEVHAQRQPETC